MLYQLNYFIPEQFHEELLSKLFSLGAGQYGDYKECCWYTFGTAQFRPMENSQPHTGFINQIQQQAELKVEMICSEQVIKQAVETLIKYHPYEQPAYHVFKHIAISEL